MLKLHKKQLFSAFALILAVALVVGTAAWFANRWITAPFPFSPTGESNPPTMVLWMYASENDILVDSAHTTVTTPQWVEYTDQDDLPFGMKAPSAGFETEQKTDPITGTEFTSYTYYASQLHFGKVDNLVTLFDDNIMYLRFAVDPIRTGKTGLIMRFDYSNQAYDESADKDPRHAMVLYKMDGSEVDLIDGDGNDDNDVIQWDPAKPEKTQFLEFSYYVSTKALEPNGTAFEDLPFAAATPVGGSKTLTGDTDFVAYTGETNADGTQNTVPVSSLTSTYYVYIRLNPKLDTFGRQENILDYFVPSFMLFDTKFTLELY